MKKKMLNKHRDDSNIMYQDYHDK